MLSVALGAGPVSSAASWASVMTWVPEYCSERIPGSRSRGRAQPDSFCVSVGARPHVASVIHQGKRLFVVAADT